MAIVTISRGTFSGGKMLAECLARTLGYPCIDRDKLVRSAANRRVSEYDLRAALEQPPDFPATYNHKRYIYLVLIQGALAGQVRDGNAVYHGLAGHLLLKGAPGLFRVRLIAPLEFRIGMAQERLRLGRNEARAYIDSMDRDRRRWTQFLYGVDWGDPSHYDLVINLENMSTEQVCRLVISAVGQCCPDYTAEQSAAMADFALASRVRAELASDLDTLNLEVDVSCHRGSVSVRGDSLTEESDAVERVVRAIPGVTGVAIADAGAKV